MIMRNSSFVSVSLYCVPLSAGDKVEYDTHEEISHHPGNFSLFASITFCMAYEYPSSNDARCGDVHAGRFPKVF